MPSRQQTTCRSFADAPAGLCWDARSARRRCGLAVPSGAVAVGLLVTACAAAPGSPRASVGEGGSPGNFTAPSFQPGSPSRATALDADPLWQRAARGDVIDLARL